MKQLLAIGEALIDFAPEETGKELKDVSAFKPKVGGAGECLRCLCKAWR